MIRVPGSNGGFDAHAHLRRAWIWGRGNGASLGLNLLVNYGLPFLIYKIGKPSLGDVHALILASSPPIAWGLIEFARSRRIDALSMLALAGIGLSLLAFLGGGGVRFLQLRERLVLAAIGVIFLVSAAIGKPLIYELSRARIKRLTPTETEWFEAMRETPVFRRAMMVMTLAWGVSLILETLVSCGLVYVLTTGQYPLVSPIIGSLALAILTAWTFWYAKRVIGPLRLAQLNAASLTDTTSNRVGK